MNKDLSRIEMQENINTELDSLIKDGLTGGFTFDEECALELEEVLYKINYLINDQQEQIEVLYDSLEATQYQLHLERKKPNNV